MGQAAQTHEQIVNAAHPRFNVNFADTAQNSADYFVKKRRPFSFVTIPGLT